MQSISELKTLVASATDLSQPLNYFFDLVERGQLQNQAVALNHKKIQQSAELTEVLKNIGNTLSNFLGRRICIRHPLLFCIQKEYFFHGTGVIANNAIPLTILYFGDIKAGIFARSDFNHTDMFRFCLLEHVELKEPH